MSVQHGLLGLLLEQPRHGYELKQAFEEKAGTFWELNYGQIYSTLDRLNRAGMVEWESYLGEGPERKTYRITKKGKEEFHRWLKEPVSKRKPLRDEFFLKLAWQSEDSESLLELIREQKRMYLQKMSELTQQKLSFGKGDMMTDLLMDAALFHAEADIRWLDHAEGKIKAWIGGRAGDKD